MLGRYQCPRHPLPHRCPPQSRWVHSALHRLPAGEAVSHQPDLSVNPPSCTLDRLHQPPSFQVESQFQVSSDSHSSSLRSSNNNSLSLLHPVHSQLCLWFNCPPSLSPHQRSEPRSRCYWSRNLPVPRYPSRQRLRAEPHPSLCPRSQCRCQLRSFKGFSQCCPTNPCQWPLPGRLQQSWRLRQPLPSGPLHS